MGNLKYKIGERLSVYDDFSKLKYKILTNRGVTDVDNFLNPSEKHCYNFNLLNNIDKAVNLLISHLNNDSKILIIVDSDNDGINSSAILYNYIKNVYPEAKLNYILHDKKQHGLYKELVIENDVKLIILPDGTSENYTEYKEYKDKKMDIILLDHHLAKLESQDAIVVNNQLSENYPNKQLSGAGIVYKFCKALDNALWVDYADNYLDLVAVGNIGDVMDSRSLETRYYMNEGIKNIKSLVLKEMIKQQELDKKGGLNINAIAFYICPLINAVIRMGKPEDKDLLFRAFINDYEEFDYKPRGKPLTKENIYEKAVRQSIAIKDKQAKERDKAISIICDKISSQNLDSNKIIIIDSNNEINKNLTGLIAQNIVEQYKKPVLMGVQKINDNGKLVLSGSGRSFGNSGFESLKDLLENTKQFVYISGHDNAFGFEIELAKVENTLNIINEKLKGVEFSKVFDIDFEICYKHMTDNLFGTINELKDVWSSNVQEPLFMIRSIELNVNTFSEFSAGKHYRFESCNTPEIITFVKFNYDSNDKLVEYITGFNCWKDRIKIDVIGKVGVNVYNGKATMQVMIEDYEITEELN